MGGSSLIYPAFTFILVLISLILIPRERYRIFFPVIIISVMIHAALMYFAINVVDAFHFIADEPFAILGIPIFISISWVPSFALFLWGLPEKMPHWAFHVYIAAFALIGVFIDMTFQSLGLQLASVWYRPWMWFFPVYLLYWATYILYQKRKQLEKI